MTPAIVLPPATTPAAIAPGQVQTTANPALVGLPVPLVNEAEPSDVLGMLMALMERMASQGVKESTTQIRINQDKLAEAMNKFREKMEEIARKAEEARRKSDSGWGFLGDICSAVCDFVGDVAGKFFGNLTDVAVDLARFNVDVIGGLLKGKNLEDLLAQEFSDITSSGKVSDTVAGAARGVSDFYRDIGNAMSSGLEAIAKGEPIADCFEDFAGDVWNSFVTNIVENPDVMKVLSAVAKVVAVATAVGSGGALACVAAGLYLLSEIDSHTGVCEKLLGEKAGPWVSAGLAIGAGVCLAFAAGADADLLKDIKQVVTLIGGATSIAAGIRTIENSLAAAEGMEDAADLKQIMNLMAQLQRIIETLLGEAEEKSENRDRIRQGAAEVYELEGEGFEAATMIRA